MTFTGRAAPTIRDALLANWTSRYSALGLQLDTSLYSPAWLFASALAVELEALEAQAEQLQAQVLPDRAAEEFLDRHGFVHGIARDPAVSARVTATVTGANGVYTYTQDSLGLTGATGVLYRPSGANATTFTVAGGTASVEVTATTTGAGTTPSVNATLTWQAAPAGINATATVAAVGRAGTDAETDAAYSQRIIARLRERPASGNRADWRAWVEDYTGVTSAYVYPLLQPPAVYPGAGTTNVLGCVTVLAIGPAQGDAVSNTRIVGGSAGASLASTIGQYIEGLRDADGNVVASGTQLRPATMTSGNYSIEAMQVSAQNVELTLALSAAASFPWTGTMTVDAASDATHLVVTGDHTAKNGLKALIFVGTSLIRGGYQEITLNTGVFAAGNTTWTFAVGVMLGTPSGTVYPPPTNWAALRTAVFAVFDGLAPGDTSPASRFPAEGETTTSTLYRARLTASAVAQYDATGELIAGVAGVLSASVVQPAADVTPAAKTVVTLGQLIVHA